MSKKSKKVLAWLLFLLVVLGGGVWWFKFRKLTDKNGNVFEIDLTKTAPDGDHPVFVNGTKNGDFGRLGKKSDGLVYGYTTDGRTFVYRGGWNQI